MKSMPKSSPEKELVRVFEAAGVVEYLEFLQSGKRTMWVNFKAGIARGFGHIARQPARSGSQRVMNQIFKIFPKEQY